MNFLNLVLLIILIINTTYGLIKITVINKTVSRINIVYHLTTLRISNFMKKKKCPFQFILG